MAKTPNPIDKHVGARVRLRRIMVGLSQEKLGEALGITFQQVQKYEKGTNRIGASRLQAAARILSVPVNYFFEGASDDPAMNGGFADGHASSFVDDSNPDSESRQLVEAFRRIREPELRKRVIELVESMAATAKPRAS